MSLSGLWDTHMHTPLCGHSVGEPEEFVRRAAKVGLAGIVITCHTPMEHRSFNPHGRTRMEEEQLPEYRAWVERAKRAGEDLGVEVRYGIEAEVFPAAGALERMRAVIERENFDFILGSLHHQVESYRIWLEENGLKEPEEIIRAYYRQLGEGFRLGLYDSVAHPDLIQIYGTVPPHDPLDYEEEIHRFLDQVAECGGCLEINTSGLNKGIFQYHPGPLLLRWARERGIGLTLGSDSHLPDRVGEHFDRILPYLRELGYREVYTFRQRKAEALSIV